MVTKREKVVFIMSRLDELYQEVPIHLKHKDPYTLLEAVLLSAQCTDKRVNKITPALFSKADIQPTLVLIDICPIIFNIKIPKK